MKISSRDGIARLTQYNPQTKRSELIDSDPDLFALMVRNGLASKEEDSEEIFGDIFTNDDSTYQESQSHIST